MRRVPEHPPSSLENIVSPWPDHSYSPRERFPMAKNMFRIMFYLVGCEDRQESNRNFPMTYRWHIGKILYIVPRKNQSIECPGLSVTDIPCAPSMMLWLSFEPLVGPDQQTPRTILLPLTKSNPRTQHIYHIHHGLPIHVFNVCIYIYIYVYIHNIHVYTHIYI